MATLKEEQIKLAAKQEMDSILKERVKELIASGQPELAAQILIEQARLELPDTHPSKGVQKLGVLEPEQLFQLTEFEEIIAMAKDGTSLLHALRAGQPTWEKRPSAEEAIESIEKSLTASEVTTRVTAAVLLKHHQGIIPQLSRQILEAKREAGLIPALPEGSAELVEGEKEDSAEDKPDSE